MDSKKRERLNSKVLGKTIAGFVGRRKEDWAISIKLLMKIENAFNFLNIFESGKIDIE